MLNAAEKRGQFYGPLFEIEFWSNKYSNLKNLDTQLKDDKITLVLKTLEKSNSTYVAGFKKMLAELNQGIFNCFVKLTVKALVEANEIYAHLVPLKRYITDLTDGTLEIKNLPQVFRPIIHLISLIWNNCKHYNTVKLVVLLREICNDVISQVCCILHNI
jgi:dynein heavy chain